MPSSKPRRSTRSKQERQALQREARLANATRKQRRGVTYVASLSLVAILFVFGVLGQNLRNDDKKKKTPTTTVQGQAGCPRADGNSKRQVYFNSAPRRCIDATRTYVAEVKTTAGNMTVEIYPSRAFNAANNFIFLARYHFYDGLPFHRVLKDTFMQTGDPVAPGVTGPGYEFADDGLPASSSQYVKGALLFAHEAADANGSQVLFITGDGGRSLNPTFPLFGQVKKGFAVLDKINAAAGTDVNVPALRYAVISIDVAEKRSE
jgi:cyclophilin family peptidyl-prolyl cis-trans isomerase